MTTSSGKPPLDEQALDSSWDAMGADAPPSEDGPVDTPQFVRPGPSANAKKAAERPMYGAGVPYGGDDRTEEIEPIGLDVPFGADEARNSAALTPRLGNTPRPAPVAAKSDAELRAPIAELVLSDLFDSAPAPSGSMAPPDPRVFTTTPPAPSTESTARGWREKLGSPWSLSRSGADAKFLASSSSPAKSPKPPSVTPQARTPSSSPARSEPALRTPSARTPSAPDASAAPPVAPGATVAANPPGGSTAAANASPALGSNPAASPSPVVSPSTVPRPSSSGVVALPSINVLAHSSSVASTSGASTSGAASASSGASGSAPSSAVSDTSEGLAGSRSERASSPPAAAEAQREREQIDTGRRSVPTLESVGNAAAARAISLGSEFGAARRPAGSGRADLESSPPLAHFASDIPTSRPPDVTPSSAPGASSSPSQPSHSQAGWTSSAGREGRVPSSSPPQSTVAALPSTRTGKHQLPSVMLGSDVEVEPDTAARRALRAARATVRIELPPNFARPGSPIGPGAFAAIESVDAPEPFLPPTFKARFLEGKKVPLAIAALFVLAACLVLLLRPRYGSLVVTALGPGQRAVDNVQIFVDDAPLCATSPCRISGLSLGTHKLRATAAGLASAEVRSVEVTSGEEATANIELTPTAASEVQAGGLRMPAGAKDYTLFIDDRRVGRLPQSVSGLASGKHWIKLEPEDGSGVIEKGVMIRAGEVADVDPMPAKRDKVLVTIRLSPESEGASVTLDDAFLLDFPAELELDPKSVHVLSATKPGYEDYSQTLQLGEGETEKLVELALVPLDGHHPHAAKPAHKPAVAKAAPAQSGNGPAIDPAEGLLNISSVPPSQIILNGRPLGSTPKTAIVVPGDSMQTIVFVHPKMGRRRAQKFVPAGKERTVSIRF